MKISVILPAYNEEPERLRLTIASIRGFFIDQLCDYEILVIDDGSKNPINYAFLAPAAVIYSDKNYGKGHALRAGVEHATGDYILFMDADGQIGIRHLVDFFRAIKRCLYPHGVIGDKFHPDSEVKYNKRRTTISRGYHAIIKILFGFKYDTQCGFKLFRANILKEAIKDTTINRFAFDIDLLCAVHVVDGSCLKTMPVTISPSTRTSTASLKNIWNMFWDTLRVWYKWKRGKYGK